MAISAGPLAFFGSRWAASWSRASAFVVSPLSRSSVASFRSFSAIERAAVLGVVWVVAAGGATTGVVAVVGAAAVVFSAAVGAAGGGGGGGGARLGGRRIVFGLAF